MKKKTPEKFVNNFDNYLEFIEKNKINCVYKKTQVKKQNEKIKEIKVVFTGFRSKELEEYIESNGGKVQSSLNKETDLLVVKNDETSGTKLEKAKELEIKIITKKQFENEYNIE